MAGAGASAAFRHGRRLLVERVKFTADFTHDFTAKP
jgi:hypothetical protein